MVDTCVARFALCAHARFGILKKWLRDNPSGRIAVSGELLDEYRGCFSVLTAYRALNRFGRVLRAVENNVEGARSIITEIGHKSDDLHILALMHATGVRIICTEDADLIDDVKNTALLSPKRKVYPEGNDQSAKRLLAAHGHHGHP